jgi:hypothetical protein
VWRVASPAARISIVGQAANSPLPSQVRSMSAAHRRTTRG